MDNWLAGRVAVVTGASRGIGAAVAEELAGTGARVVIAARGGADLEQVAERIGAAAAVPADVAVESDVERLFDEAARIGDVSVLVTAAGILAKAPFDELETATWREVLDVNLTGTFLCCRRAFGPMRAAGGGRIVTFGSLSGVYATEKFPGLVAYNVSKYGVVGLTEGIAVEGRPHGISAICISPGAVDTQMLRDANPDLRAGLVPADVGRLVRALLDEAVAPASGANIPLFSNVTGG